MLAFLSLADLVKDFVTSARKQLSGDLSRAEIAERLTKARAPCRRRVARRRSSAWTQPGAGGVTLCVPRRIRYQAGQEFATRGLITVSSQDDGDMLFSGALDSVSVAVRAPDQLVALKALRV